MQIRNYFLFICIIFYYSFLLIIQKSYAQTSRFNGEIMGEVIGLDGWIEWRVNAQCISSHRWDLVNGDCYLTNDYETASIEGTGNSPSFLGFKAPCGHQGHENDIAFGNYRFSFDLPGSNDDIAFTLDLRYPTGEPHLSNLKK